MISIQNSTQNDIPEIFRLYSLATQLQIKKKAVPWPNFDPRMIENEIIESRQFKIVIEDQIACVWAITFDDPDIWGIRNNDPAIYIHRIATNPEFKGQKLVHQIVVWAKSYAANNSKNFIRMDTVGNNLGLITYYTKCGFEFLGLHKLENTHNLPSHYDRAIVSLFEIKL